MRECSAAGGGNFFLASRKGGSPVSFSPSSSCLAHPLCLWSCHPPLSPPHAPHPTTVAGNQAFVLSGCVLSQGRTSVARRRPPLLRLPSILLDETQPAPCSTRNPKHRTTSPLHPTHSNMVLFGGRGGGGRSTGVASTPAAPAPRYVLAPPLVSFLLAPSPPSLLSHEL